MVGVCVCDYSLLSNCPSASRSRTAQALMWLHMRIFSQTTNYVQLFSSLRGNLVACDGTPISVGDVKHFS